MKNYSFTIDLTIDKNRLQPLFSLLKSRIEIILVIFLSIVSVVCFVIFYQNGLGLAYNDARSHLDIGRRVVEGLKPGLAQIGSVWLPLPHLLMIPTIWNDFMWHSGLSGALQSMISYVLIGYFIFLTLKEMQVGLLGRIFAVLVFALNVNILYMQSIAMTELLLLCTILLTSYEFMLWNKNEKILHLIKTAFWVMLATLIRYEGWFLLGSVTLLILVRMWKKKGYRVTEGVIILFLTLAAWGIFLWFSWNQLIFKDALYFMFGPFSAHSQQQQLQEAGVLVTKNNFLLSLKIYFYALIFNSTFYIFLLSGLGYLWIWIDKKLNFWTKLSTLNLLSPLIFNVLALFLGFSVLFIQGISGNTWFNVRYGLMMLPSFAIFTGFLLDRLVKFRPLIIGLTIFVYFFIFTNLDAVTIDDARVGSSQKNVFEVSGYLKNNAGDKKGFILISAASHDAIIFSSGLPMKRFIHEGTGGYWESAITSPDRWARWIVMRTYDNNDLTFKAVNQVPRFFTMYNLVAKYPFADVYELKEEFRKNLITEPVLSNKNKQ
ncbi:hypothetical protein HY345_03670 [Candidatus Microgenomates bacterium]|nr:hypothetical protein [Candidatus Microgenomates bacterium]